MAALLKYRADNRERLASLKVRREGRPKFGEVDMIFKDFDRVFLDHPVKILKRDS